MSFTDIDLLPIQRLLLSFNLFFFTDTPTTEIYTLSLHDALPICRYFRQDGGTGPGICRRGRLSGTRGTEDRKSTRLNSSHVSISYAVFCLKKKNSYYIVNNF